MQTRRLRVDHSGLLIHFGSLTKGSWIEGESTFRNSIDIPKMQSGHRNGGPWQW